MRVSERQRERERDGERERGRERDGERERERECESVCGCLYVYTKHNLCREGENTDIEEAASPMNRCVRDVQYKTGKR